MLEMYEVIGDIFLFYTILTQSTTKTKFRHSN